MNAGEWRKGEEIFIGPKSDGSYIKTSVKSVQISGIDTSHVWAGHAAGFALALNKADRKAIRKGMVMLKAPAKPTRFFSADICLLKGEGTTIIKGKYQTVIHVLHVKQTARVIDFTVREGSMFASEASSVLRPGMVATVKFQFINRPEYIRKGMRLLMRDGHVRGIGIVKEVHH